MLGRLGRLSLPRRMSSSAPSSVSGIVPVSDRSTLRIRSPQLQSIATGKYVLARNGLEVYCVSDPLARESGAAMTIETGSWRDDVDAQGTAHFLEHMLFLGTQKYPDENEYDRFVKDHGGQLNAYTASDHTTYMVSVRNDAFEGALDRFAQFFHAPLFNPSCVEREQNAVDEEFRKNISDDGWRAVHVLKELARPEHPHAFFNTGNLASMKLIDQARLHQWYRKHYVAPAMRLVLYSPRDLHWLQSVAASLFSPIPSSSSSPAAPTRESLKVNAGECNLYPASLRASWVHIVPLKNTREITLMWEIPAALSSAVHETKPASLACTVLGHEGEESLYAWLQRDNLVEHLSAGTTCHGGDNWVLQLHLVLTTTGLAQRETVVARVFSALREFASFQAFPDHVRDEVNTMARTHYQFQPRASSVFGAVTKLAQSLRREPLETYPQQLIETKRVDQSQMRKLWLHLQSPSNVIVKLVAPAGALEAAAAAFKTEQHMGARYAVHKFTPRELDRYTDGGLVPNRTIAFPRPNPYIPRKLSVSSAPLVAQPLVIVPKTAQNDDRSHVVTLDDRFFGDPVVHWSVRVHSPAIRGDSAASVARSAVWAALVDEQLRTPNYTALLAGLSFHVSPMATGIALSLSGYTDKALAVWANSLELVKAMVPKQTAFERVRDRHLRSLENSLKNLPVRQAIQAAMRSQYAVPLSTQDHIQAMKDLTLDDVLAFARQWHERTFIEATLTGQTTDETAAAVVAAVAKHFQPAVADRATVTKKPAIKAQARDIVESSQLTQGNAALLMIDTGACSVENNVWTHLISNALSEPFNSELRTRQQTGYIVWCSSTVLQRERTLLYLTSQSSTVTPQGLLDRYQTFLRNTIAQWNDPAEHGSLQQRFATIRQSYETGLSHSYNNLGELSSMIESCTFDRAGVYTEREQALAFVRSITVSDFIRAVNARLVDSIAGKTSTVLFTGEQRADLVAKL